MDDSTEENPLEDSGDEREETIEELLNGPKDSVTMFGHRSNKAFHIDMSSGGDPLDLLMAHQHQLSATDGSAGSLNGACSSQSRGDMQSDSLVLVDLTDNEESDTPVKQGELQHSQELAYRCRHALHQQLDVFLNGAARREAASPSSDPTTELVKQLADQRKELADLRRHVQSLQMQNLDAWQSLKETQAELDAARLEIRSSAHEKMEALAAQASSCAGLDEARAELKQQKEELDLLREDTKMLRAERETLRVLSSQQLGELAETFTESLLRVQREQQRKFTQFNDEQLCVVCLSERKNVVLRPCNHLTMCVNCFDQCKSACPQCRSPVQDHLIIYM